MAGIIYIKHSHTAGIINNNCTTRVVVPYSTVPGYGIICVAVFYLKHVNTDIEENRVKTVRRKVLFFLHQLA